MAKLVILNQGMTGRTYDLKVGRTSIGRLAENNFEIPDASVSSRHCEIHWRSEAATDFFFRDLGSTNGSWLNDDKVSEAKLNIGQTFRIGQVEIRIVDGQAPIPSAPPPAPVGAQAPAPVTSAPPPPAPVGKKQSQENTMVVTRGVSLEQLEQGNKASGFDTNTVFTKKKSKVNMYFIIGGIIAAVVIGALLIIVFKQAGGPPPAH